MSSNLSGSTPEPLQSAGLDWSGLAFLSRVFFVVLGLERPLNAKELRDIPSPKTFLGHGELIAAIVHFSAEPFNQLDDEPESGKQAVRDIRPTQDANDCLDEFGVVAVAASVTNSRLNKPGSALLGYDPKRFTIIASKQGVSRLGGERFRWRKRALLVARVYGRADLSNSALGFGQELKFFRRAEVR